MTVINLGDYRARESAFLITANGTEHLIRFDLFADRAAMIAWLTPLAPPGYAPAEDLKAACLHGLDNTDGGHPHAWIALCRGDLRASTIAKLCVIASTIRGIEGDEQARFVEELLSCCLKWLADDGETLDAEVE